MILKIDHPKVSKVKILDSITQELLDMAIDFDTETGEAWAYAKDEEGKWIVDWATGAFKTFKLPNKVIIIVPKEESQLGFLSC